MAWGYTPKVTHSKELSGSCRWGDFKLLSMLGKGGHSSVFRALHRPSGKQVAVKILSGCREADHDLEREERIHSHLHHQSVSKFYCTMGVLEGGTVDDRKFATGDVAFVLELVEGGSLRDLMKSGNSFDAKGIIIRLVRTLQFLRTQGIVFGDLSSANVMVTKAGGVKLIDFGAALEVKEGRQEAQPIFVSYKTRPHRWCNHAADWFSLGLLIEEVLLYRESRKWRGQREFSRMSCSQIIRDKAACDLVSHLIPAGRNWGAVWGISERTVRKILAHKFFQ